MTVGNVHDLLLISCGNRIPNESAGDVVCTGQVVLLVSACFRSFLYGMEVFARAPGVHECSSGKKCALLAATRRKKETTAAVDGSCRQETRAK